MTRSDRTLLLGLALGLAVGAALGRKIAGPIVVALTSLMVFAAVYLALRITRTARESGPMEIEEEPLV